MKEYLQMFAKTFDYKGKSSPREFWFAQLFNFLFAMLFCLLASPYSKDVDIFYKAVFALEGLYSVVVFLPGLSLLCRRLRDAGFSAFVVLLALIPFVGEIILFCMLCMPSKVSIKPIYNNSNQNIYNTNLDQNNIQNQTNFGQNEQKTEQNTQVFAQNNQILNNEEQKRILSNEEDKQADLTSKNDEYKPLDNQQNNVDDKKIIADTKKSVTKSNKGSKSISKSQQSSRSNQIKLLQQKRDSGEISIEEYHQEILKILSK